MSCYHGPDPPVIQTGLMDDGLKLTLLGSWMALFLIFAGRKFSQPIKVVFHHSMYESQDYSFCLVFDNKVPNMY